MKYYLLITKIKQPIFTILCKKQLVEGGAPTVFTAFFRSKGRATLLGSIRCYSRTQDTKNLGSQVRKGIFPSQ